MFITLEGIEGSGKTTQVGKIADFLENQGRKVVITREPGATAIGRSIRSVLLDPVNVKMTPVCELLLYGADRAQHIAEVIVPALSSGKIVVCDRFADATSVYQGVARGIDFRLINSVHDIVVGNIVPDLTILFDLDPEIGLQRTFDALEQGMRPKDESRFEQEKIQFHEKVRKGYLELAKNQAHRFLVVDASRKPDDVFEMIVSGFKRRIKI